MSKSPPQRLINSSGKTVKGRAWASVEYQCNNTDSQIGFQIRRNGVFLPGAGSVAFNADPLFATWGDTMHIESPVKVTLNPGDYLSLWTIPQSQSSNIDLRVLSVRLSFDGEPL
jgi:hypothetical protein